MHIRWGNSPRRPRHCAGYPNAGTALPAAVLPFGVLCFFYAGGWGRGVGPGKGPGTISAVVGTEGGTTGAAAEGHIGYHRLRDGLERMNPGWEVS